MKKNIVFTILGILFGIIMSKSEAASWFRIHEMFRFESFHMFGIIGVAVITGIIIIQVMKRSKMKTIEDKLVDYQAIPLNYKRHIIAGSIFGLGWALLGACPGPIYVMIGHGFGIFFIVVIGALIGTLIYGSVRNKLPH